MVRTRFASPAGLLLTGAMLLGTTLAGATAAMADTAKVRTLEGITEYCLDNGLQVLLYPDASKPTVTVNLTVLRRLAARRLRRNGHGPSARTHGVQGHAHASAHSQGPARTRRPLQRHHLGRPHELLRDPAGQRRQSELRLELEADRLVNSFIKQEDLFSEMTVVRSEFERGENSPSNLLNQRIMSTAFDWHNYGKIDDRQPHATSSACPSRTCTPSTRSTTSPTIACW